MIPTVGSRLSASIIHKPVLYSVYETTPGAHKPGYKPLHCTVACVQYIYLTKLTALKNKSIDGLYIYADFDGTDIKLYNEWLGGPIDGMELRVYDPDLDLAVLAVPKLKAPALTMTSSVDAGDSTVIAGFPLDGPYTVNAARVRGAITARSENIYGDDDVVREIGGFVRTHRAK